MESRRRFGRFERQLRVEITADPRPIRAETVNISLGGMLIASGLDPARGQLLSARVYIPEPDHVCEVTLQVMWTRPGGFGVAFDALRPVDAWALLRYLEGSAKTNP